MSENPVPGAATDATEALLDRSVFRDVIGRFASGVTIITTRHDGRDFGTTGSAVSSLSMEPPMLLVCLNRTSETGKAILSAGRFVVNILGEDQADVAHQFATKDPDKFVGLDSVRGLEDVPILADTLGHLECRVAETATGGTHTVFLSHVERAGANEGSPLTYYRGRFGRFEDAAEEAAYREIRRLIMSRAIGADERLGVNELAEELSLERPRVQYALLKLTADGLVERDPVRGHIVRPVDAKAATDAIDARSAIEEAVADRVAGHIDPVQLSELRGHADVACRAVEREPPDYERLRSAGRAFHGTFIGLAKNDSLLELYERLRIDAIWSRHLKGRHLSPEYLRVVTEACATGDADAAKAAIRDHAEAAAAVAVEMIDRAGGKV